MQEILGRILDEIRGAWRFRWLAVAVAWAVAIAGWIVVMRIPDIYEARARVYVDMATALKPLLRGLAPEADVESQLNMVRQALLSRPQLEKVARDTDLDIRARTPKEMEALLIDIAQRIRLEMVQPNRRERREITDALYVISFQDRDRGKSLEVVQTLVNNFMEDTLGGKRSGSQSAQRFLEQQLRDYESRLSTAEATLAEFKKRNVGLMPDESGDYFSRLQSENQALNVARSGLRQALARREAIRAQMSGERPYTAGAQPGAARGPASQNDIDARIRDTEARLDDLLLRFTDRHPEVIAARSTLEELRAKREQELAALARGETGSGLAAREANPVYQSLRLLLNEAEVQVASMQSDIADRQRVVAELESRINVAPEVEAELARLNRDYGVTKTQYDALLGRLESARLSEQADESGIVGFDVIDPPSASLTPVAPNRRMLTLAVFVLAGAAGGGVAYLLHLLRPVFSNPRMLSHHTGLVVLGAVSPAGRDRGLAGTRLDLALMTGAAGALALALLAMLMWQRIQ